MRIRWSCRRSSPRCPRSSPTSATEDTRPNMTRFLQATRLGAAVIGLLAAPALVSAQRPLVYCPVGIDETGCAAVVNALGEADRAFDGSLGTVDLRTADLGQYTVL